ncbi:1652_t:CDS:2, partial [Racocetra fulgida]
MTQIIGGALTDKFGGKVVLGIDYSGISKDELDWILGKKLTISKSTDKFTDFSENQISHNQPCSSEYVTISDNNLGLSRSENDMLLPKDQISSRSHKIQKIPWKLLFSRREVWATMLGPLFH